MVYSCRKVMDGEVNVLVVALSSCRMRDSEFKRYVREFKYVLVSVFDVMR